MGTLIVSIFAKAGTAVINVIKRNKYFFIVLSTAKMLKIHEAAYSFMIKVKLVINRALCALTI